MLIILTSTTSILIVYAVMFASSARVTGLAGEVFYCIEKAEYTSGLPAVILGDSVCNQLWPQKEDSENITHLGCNQAISAAGTYLLLKNYLEHNPQTKAVFYIVRPASLGNDLYLNYTYQYFVIPFMNGDNVNFLDDETTEKIYNNYGKIFVENGYIKNFLLNNNFFMKLYVDYVRTHKEETTYFHQISRTSVIYLNKLRKLCSEHNVILRVIPCPLSDISQNHGWENFSRDIQAYGFSDIFGDFVQRIHYYPEEWFRDTSHFKQEILEEYGDGMRAKVMEGINPPAE